MYTLNEAELVIITLSRLFPLSLEEVMYKVENKIGEVTHYYTKLGVGIIKLSKPLKVGAAVHFKGFTTDFTQEVSEMQYDHDVIESGKKGQEVGVKVNEMVREGDEVFSG